MYFPYLRGKQFELLALRELTALPLDAAKIIPIIEPVKKDLKSIETAIKALFRIKVMVQLIVNPEHGDLKRDHSSIFGFIERMVAQGVDNIIPTYLIANERDFKELKATASVNGYLNSGYALVHLNQIASANELKNISSKTNLKFNTINSSHIMALRRGYPMATLAILTDPFIKQKRNVDYEDYDDEFFSSDYFYYEQEGFTAFADYLTIGVDYIEGGMLPNAVVIHLTYKDYHSDDIRIRRFISDSNLDSSDPAGKFGEALGKLIEFVNSENIQTLGANQFRDYYNRSAYPGLGVIKKLSIMHHIELVQSLI